MRLIDMEANHKAPFI